MNKITLHGIIRDINYSHIVQDTEYNKANLVVKRETGKEDIITLKFKKFSNPYNENDEISLIGNIRTYSQKLHDRNKVDVYCFTYFDEPEEELLNVAEIDGRICKKSLLHKTQTGKDVLDFVIASNLVTDNQVLNCYIPCVAWGKNAKELDKVILGTNIFIIGELQSRTYKKKISEDDFEIRVAHELNIKSFEIIKD